MGTRSAVPGREPSLGRGREKNAVSVPSGRPRWSWRCRSRFRSPVAAVSPAVGADSGSTVDAGCRLLRRGSLALVFGGLGLFCADERAAAAASPLGCGSLPCGRFLLGGRLLSCGRFPLRGGFALRCAHFLAARLRLGLRRPCALPLRLVSAVFVCPGAETFPRATPLPGTVTPRGAICPSRDPGCSAAGRVAFAGFLSTSLDPATPTPPATPAAATTAATLSPRPPASTPPAPAAVAPVPTPARRRRRPRLRSSARRPRPRSLRAP